MVLVFITAGSLGLAVVMTLVAWHAVSSERRRSVARVARLAAEIRREDPIELTDDWAAPVQIPQLFEEAAAASPGSRAVTRGAVGALAFCTLAALAVFFVRSGAPGSAATRDRGTSAAVQRSADPRQPAPLELVALQHEREADQLTVRGVVRNPAAGAILDHLSAVVLLLNAEGALISSTRASVAAQTLAPGSETTFAVTVPNATNVERYRVSFRTDQEVIPHVDRRT